MQWDSSEKAGRLKAIPTSTHAPKSTPAVEEGPFDKRTTCWACPEVEGEPEGPGRVHRGCRHHKAHAQRPGGLCVPPWVGYVTAPLPGPQTQPDPPLPPPPRPSVSAAERPLSSRKRRPAPCGKFPTFLPHRKINNCGGEIAGAMMMTAGRSPLGPALGSSASVPGPQARRAGAATPRLLARRGRHRPRGRPASPSRAPTPPHPGGAASKSQARLPLPANALGIPRP